MIFLFITGIHDTISYKIYSTAGQLVMEGNTSKKIDVTELSHGVYLLKLSDLTSRLIVKDKQ